MLRLAAHSFDLSGIGRQEQGPKGCTLLDHAVFSVQTATSSIGDRVVECFKFRLRSCKARVKILLSWPLHLIVKALHDIAYPYHEVFTGVHDQ